MLKRLLLPILLMLTVAAAIAAPPAQLAESINAIIGKSRSDPKFRPARIGIAIQSLDDGTTWYAKAQSQSFIPASTTKLVTAALALELLPQDFRFATRLYAAGDIREETLQGNLILRGGGDPTLTPEGLRALAHALAQGNAERDISPVKRITGRLLLDGSAFPRSTPQLGLNWEKGDLLWYYAAPSSPLSCNRNAILVTVRGTTHGAPPIVTLTPDTKLFTVMNKAVTSGNVKTGSVDFSPNGSRLTITGKVAPGAELTEEFSVRNPDRFITEQCLAALAEEGITVEGQDLQNRLPGTLLAEQLSPALQEVVEVMLKISDNHTAEQLRWTLLAQLHASTPLGTRYPVIQQDLAKRAGIPTGHLQMVDGSGLSRGNHLRPDALLHLLVYLHGSPQFDAFYRALPIAGVDGTLKKRMIGTPAEGNAHAKTGTMRGVSGLGGYVDTKSGERLAFVIFVNNYRSGSNVARELQDRIVSYLAGL